MSVEYRLFFVLSIITTCTYHSLDCHVEKLQKSSVYNHCKCEEQLFSRKFAAFLTVFFSVYNYCIRSQSSHTLVVDSFLPVFFGTRFVYNKIQYNSCCSKFSAICLLENFFTTIVSTVDLCWSVGIFAATTIVSAYTIVVNETELPNVGCLCCLKLLRVIFC
jgi:hypothetical protein